MVIDTTIFKTIGKEKTKELEFLLHLVAYHQNEPIDVDMTSLALSMQNPIDFVEQVLFRMRNWLHRTVTNLPDGKKAFHREEGILSEIILQDNEKEFMIDLFFDKAGRLRRDVKYAVDVGQIATPGNLCWNILSPQSRNKFEESKTLYGRFHNALVMSGVVDLKHEYLSQLSLVFGETSYQLVEPSESECFNCVIGPNNNPISLKVSTGIIQGMLPDE